MINRRFLQSHALFGGISDAQISVVMTHLKQERYPAGAYLFHQREVGDRLLLIVEGSVEVLSTTASTAPVRLAVRGVGDSVGEMALIDVQSRSASVRTLEPVRALSLSYHNLSRIYQIDPELYTRIIINIAREISRRLRSMDSLLSSALYDAADCLARAPRPAAKNH